jgi:hypothetical protein
MANQDPKQIAEKTIFLAFTNSKRKLVVNCVVKILSIKVENRAALMNMKGHRLYADLHQMRSIMHFYTIDCISYLKKIKVIGY